MSTSAVIKVEGIDFCEFYVHYDGYPSGLLPFLGEFNKKFTEIGGDDPEYKIAQLIRHSTLYQKLYDDEIQCTGFGVVRPNSCGCNYEYTLYKNGKVSYRSVG